MNFNIGIYSITSPSGRQYIGQTAQGFAIRWAKHRRDLAAGTHHCHSLQRAYWKYGADALVFAKIAFVPVDQLDRREQEQIDARPKKMLYNTSFCVAFTARGIKRRPETLLRMSASRKGKCVGAEHPYFGKKRPPEVGAAISAGLKNKPLSAEHCAKLSIGRRGKCTGVDHPKSRAVICVETRVEFATISAAVEHLRTNGFPKASHQNINAVCVGRRLNAYGYTWQYGTVPHVAVRVQEYAEKEAA